MTPDGPIREGDSFADVNRACHAFLMDRDASYRKAYDGYSAQIAARKERQSREKTRAATRAARQTQWIPG